MKFLLLSLLLGLATQLTVYAQTDLSSYIGNDSLRIIPLKESVLYKDQWNRLALQSALYGQEYQPIIMKVSGAKYRMDDKEKSVLWVMPDSGSTKVTLRVGKNTKKGIAFRVKDFEFTVVPIKLELEIRIDGKPLYLMSKSPKVNASSSLEFKVIPDSNMVKQCPTYKYYVGKVDIWKETQPAGLAIEKNKIRLGKAELARGMTVRLKKIPIFKMDLEGISTHVEDFVPDKNPIMEFRVD